MDPITDSPAAAAGTPSARPTLFDATSSTTSISTNTSTSTTTTTTDQTEVGASSSSSETTILWPLIVLILLILALASLAIGVGGLLYRKRHYDTRLRNKLIGTILFIAVSLSIATHIACNTWSVLENTNDDPDPNSWNDSNDIKAIGLWGVYNMDETCLYGIGTSFNHHTTTARATAVLASLCGAISFMVWMGSQFDTKPKFLASLAVVFGLCAIACEGGSMIALYRSIPCREETIIAKCTMWGTYNTATLGGVFPILAMTYWSTAVSVMIYVLVLLGDDAIRETDVRA